MRQSTNPNTKKSGNLLKIIYLTFMATLKKFEIVHRFRIIMVIAQHLKYLETLWRLSENALFSKGCVKRKNYPRKQAGL